VNAEEKNNVRRIADALERIARALEHREFGQTVEDVRATSAQLAADAEKTTKGEHGR
jgi:uncharacterized protein YukE